MSDADLSALSGIVQLWSFDCAAVPPPTELAGTQIGSEKATIVETWFQGHLFASQDANKQYSVLGIPARAPPPIHGCMISEHDKPTYYDVYISEYSPEGPIIKMCALNVERSGGSGDAIELTLEPAITNTAPTTTNTNPTTATYASHLKLSTTRLLTGRRAKEHLAKYAPNALDLLSENSEAVVCLGVISAR